MKEAKINQLFPGHPLHLYVIDQHFRLEENSYVPSQIAVELNERILSKAEYSTTVLHENDILEIVSFMGGGR